MTYLETLDDVVVESELNVAMALAATYSKALTILENADESTDLSAFMCFQEGEILNGAIGKGKNESTITKIVKFLPRLLRGIVDAIRRKILSIKAKAVIKKLNKLDIDDLSELNMRYEMKHKIFSQTTIIFNIINLSNQIAQQLDSIGIDFDKAANDGVLIQALKHLKKETAMLSKDRADTTMDLETERDAFINGATIRYSKHHKLSDDVTDIEAARISASGALTYMEIDKAAEKLINIVNKQIKFYETKMLTVDNDEYVHFALDAYREISKALTVATITYDQIIQALATSFLKSNN